MQEGIEKILEEQVRPALESHGGGVELVEIQGNKIFLKLSGGCQGCPGARATMKNGIERIIQQTYPDIEVVDATNHAVRD